MGKCFKKPAYNFPAPKKGKLRLILKQNLTKKPSSKVTHGKAWKSTPYTRSGHAALRVDRLKWKRTFQDLIALKEKDAIKLLSQDGLMPTWEGRIEIQDFPDIGADERVVKSS